MTHHCHAVCCSRRVDPKLFVCGRHWRKLHPLLRHAIWQEYEPGQEQRKDPTPDYMAVQQCAVAYLAKADGLLGDVAVAGVNAMVFEMKCREQGREPLAGLPRAWEML